MAHRAATGQSPPPAGSALALLGFLAVVVLAAVIAGMGSAGAGEQYAALERPDWAPPAWLFTPVWGGLYVLIAFAGWLSWRAEGFDLAMVPYFLQLLLNAAWPLLFFAAEDYLAALVEIGVLWLMIAATVLAFWQRSIPAAVLLVPYWLWVTYAALLNLSIWWLNR